LKMFCSFSTRSRSRLRSSPIVEHFGADLGRRGRASAASFRSAGINTWIAASTRRRHTSTHAGAAYAFGSRRQSRSDLGVDRFPTAQHQLVILGFACNQYFSRYADIASARRRARAFVCELSLPRRARVMAVRSSPPAESFASMRAGADAGRNHHANPAACLWRAVTTSRTPSGHAILDDRLPPACPNAPRIALLASTSDAASSPGVRSVRFLCALSMMSGAALAARAGAHGIARFRSSDFDWPTRWWTESSRSLTARPCRPGPRPVAVPSIDAAVGPHIWARSRSLSALQVRSRGMSLRHRQFPPPRAGRTARFRMAMMSTTKHAIAPKPSIAPGAYRQVADHTKESRS